MRSGGVVGKVQEKADCNRQPAPIRYPQPLSQGLTALPAPLAQGSQAPRGPNDGGARDLPAARAAQGRREPGFPATEAVK